MELRDQLQRSLGGAYTLERELSGGGMSRVFVADEPTLGRKIVVKVLPPETAAGVSAERFKREIQVAARLQHPHIVPLLSAGETDGLPFYTMPYVKGESLRARLSRGGEFSVNEAVHILRDVGAALAYAHGEGVVHRDIKPDNVILSGGVAVVTDFGVAKAMDLAASDGGVTMAGITSLGIALGTPAYMAPEQASADPHVDHRADIYSFGCLAYELLTGTSPFAGRPLQQMLAAHVTEAPQPIALRRPNLPPLLADLVMKCLEKRAGDRPQSATELLAMLDAIATPSGGLMPTAAQPALARRARTRLVGWAALALLVIAGTAWLLLRHPFRPFTVASTASVAITPAIEMNPSISPDGKFVAFDAFDSHGHSLYVQQIDGGRPVVLATGLKTALVAPSLPSWSPDGSKILFLTQGDAFEVPSLGGSPRRVVSGTGLVLGAAYSHDGKQIVYADEKGLSVMPADGSAPPRVLVVARAVQSPSWSPDDRHLVFVAGIRSTIGNSSAGAISIVPAAGGDAIAASDNVHVNASPVWAPDGRSLLYVSNRGGSLDVYQQPVTASGKPDGEPVRLTTGLNTLDISLSADGKRLAYDVVRATSNIAMVQAQPAGVASLASATLVTNENQIIEGMSLSPDGKWLAYDSNRSGVFEIYKMPASGGESTQLTSDSTNDFQPAWSPDGSQLAFHTPRHGNRDIYVVSADGTSERAVTNTPEEDFYPSFSPDGRQLCYSSAWSDTTVIRIVTRNADGSWSAPKNIATHASGTYSAVRWSPDGRMIVMSGKAEEIVNVDGSNRRLLVGPELNPVRAEWAADSKSLYVAETLPDGRHAIAQWPADGGPSRLVVVGDSTHAMYRFDFATDGKRFFFPAPHAESDVWVADLKR